MSPKQSKNDMTLLAGIAGAVVAGAAIIIVLAGLGSESDTARETSRPAASQRVATKARNAPTPAVRPAAAQPMEVEAPVQLASYDKTETPPAEMPEAPVEAESAPATIEIDPDANFIARGLEAWQSRDYEVAAAYFAAEVDTRPARSWPQYMLGLSLWKSGRADEAAVAMEQAGKLNPDSIKAFVNLSRIHNDRGDYGAALEAASAARAIDDTDAKALFLEGRSLMNLGREDEALAALERSVSIDADNGHVHNLIGLMHLQRDRAAEALVALTRAGELEPGVAYIQNNLGMAFELSGQGVEAVAAYRRAVEAGAGHERARLNLARLEPTVPTSPAPATEDEAVAAVREEVAESRPLELNP